jgi:hypothetical protein
MGEIADWLLEGGGCEWCGVYLEGDAGGYPRLCGGCAEDARKRGFTVNKHGQITKRPPEADHAD